MDKIVEIKHDEGKYDDPECSADCGFYNEHVDYDCDDYYCCFRWCDIHYMDYNAGDPSKNCPGPGKYRMTLEKMLHELHGTMWVDKGYATTQKDPECFLLFHDDDGENVTFVANCGEVYGMPSADFYAKFEQRV